MDCLRDLMATLTNQTLLVMVGSYPRHKRATIPRQTRAPPTISLCHCPQNTTAGRVWLYTLLYGNSLYRLYATAIHDIQHTAQYSVPQAWDSRPSRSDAAQPKLVTPVSCNGVKQRTYTDCPFSRTPDTATTCGAHFVCRTSPPRSGGLRCGLFGPDNG